jgi:hypothetical protein
MDEADELKVSPGSPAYKSAHLYIKVLVQARTLPHPDTQRMIDHLCEIIYHNLVFISVTEGSDILVNVQDVEGCFQQAMIQIPVDWLETFLEDPIYQVGGVLYTGSQAVDFYNGRFALDHNNSTALAQAHESELLKLVDQEFPEYQLDSYQKHLLEKFPDGLDSPRARELLYPLAPVEAIEA